MLLISFLFVAFHGENTENTVDDNAADSTSTANREKLILECMETFQGIDCGGRQLRVQRKLNYNKNDSSSGIKRRLSGSSSNARYYSNAMSCKCTTCGEVGHRSNECESETPIVTPCHLCAGTDHDAGTCGRKTTQHTFYPL